MARTLGGLADRLDKLAEESPKMGSNLAVKTAFIGLKVLYNRTPVDTSQAVSNWIVSLEKPDYRFIDPYVPGYLGYTAASSIAAAMMQAENILATKKPGQTIYITNNAPYIRDLNSGTSRQDPGGFVEASALIMRKSLKH